MKAVICMKPIKSELIYPGQSRLEEYAINPYDLNALEKMAELKKKYKCQVICLCMGPKSAEDILRKSLSLGMDDAILVSDARFGGSDTVATSYILERAIRKIENVNLVVCGKRSIDGETGQVVYGIAERLNYYCLSDLDDILACEDEKIKVTKVNGSEKITGILELPAVVSFGDFTVKTLNISLPALKNAKKKELTFWNAADLEVELEKSGLKGSRTKVLEAKRDVCEKSKQYIEGSAKEKAQFLCDILTMKKR